MVRLTQRWDYRDDIDGPSAEVDSMPVPVDELWSTFIKIRHLPCFLSDHPIVKSDDCSNYGAENYRNISDSGTWMGELGRHTTKT